MIVNRSTDPAPIESRDWDSLLDERQGLFDRQWKYLWQHSPFYRDKLSAAGLREMSRRGWPTFRRYRSP